VCHDAQVINPKKDLPVGLLGSLGVVTTLYVLMAATLILLIPYTAIDPAASFAAAFAVGLSLSYPHPIAPNSLAAAPALVGIQAVPECAIQGGRLGWHL